MEILVVICFIAGGFGALLQGMVGIGTGIVIVPLLTFLLPYFGIPQALAIHVAIATSMAAIAINSVSALVSHYRRENIKWLLFNTIIWFSIIGAVMGALIAAYLPACILQKIFGVFLLLIAIPMWRIKSSTETAENTLLLPLPKIIVGGLSIGFIASIVGSGGGVLMVPFLRRLKFKMQHAVGTSTLIGFPVAIMGALIYIGLGSSQMPLNTPTIGFLHWPAFIAITFAGMIGAPLGVRLSQTLKTHLLQRLFAILVIFIGLKMIF